MTNEIIVVGAGMVGSAMALAAAKLDYKVILLDPQTLMDKAFPSATNVEQFDTRVSALTASSQQLLRSLSGSMDVLQAAQPYRKMDVWDSRGSGRILFDADEIYAEQLGLITENRQLLQQLHKSILSHSQIDFLQTKVKQIRSLPNCIEVTTTEGGSIKADCLFGTDGANSITRKCLNLPTREWDYGQQAIVATVNTSRPHKGVAYQRFLASGPLAFLPLKDSNNTGHFSSIVWSLDVAKHQEISALQKIDFLKILGSTSEFKLGEILDCSQRYSFPLRQRHAKQYVAERSALLGDAAHTIHPLAGQGVNLGFADVKVMQDELHRAKQRGLNPGNREVLNRYQRRRLPANLAMMAAMEGFKQGFGSDAKLLTWIRNQGLNLTDKLLPVKKQVIRQTMGF